MLHKSVITVGPCSYPECNGIGIGEDAFCFKCDRNFCRLHHDADDHTCRYYFALVS